MANTIQKQRSCLGAVNYGQVFSISSLNSKVYEIPKQMLQRAGVVLAKDWKTNNLTAFYGLDHINKVLSNATDKPALVVTIEIDEASGDLDRLFKIVEKLKGKGSCDYRLSTGNSD